MSPKNILFISFIIFTFGVLAVAVAPLKEGAETTSWPEALEREYGAPAYKSIDPNQNIIGQKLRIQIGDREFEIPKVFISSPVKDGDQVDGLNLIYVLPDFTPRSAFKSKAEYQEALDNQRFGNMLIRPLNNATPIKKIIENKKKFGLLTRTGQSEYGLTFFTDEHVFEGVRSHYNDHYIEFDQNGDAKSVLECRHAGTVKYSGCRFYFVDNGLHYTVSFNREKYLKEWKSIREHAVLFVNSFIKK